MYYVIWRTESGDVGGFIMDDSHKKYSDDIPKSWPDYYAARDAMRGHILQSRCEIIEIK
jgi:hypothetical protein